jgi:hypothetical protein
LQVFSTIGFVVLIFLFLLREGMPFFSTVPLDNVLARRGIPPLTSSARCPSSSGRCSSR